ncbi:MAG: hypothetical protein ABII01_05310 [Candidatus Woesearchaeota archaeon]
MALKEETQQMTCISELLSFSQSHLLGLRSCFSKARSFVHDFANRHIDDAVETYHYAYDPLFHLHQIYEIWAYCDEQSVLGRNLTRKEASYEWSSSPKAEEFRDNYRTKSQSPKERHMANKLYTQALEIWDYGDSRSVQEKRHIQREELISDWISSGRAHQFANDYNHRVRERVLKSSNRFRILGYIVDLSSPNKN